MWNFGTYVDGTNNHSKWLTLQRAPQLGSSGFAIETVKEVQLITNQFSAEFGGHSAGVASMITKSGTNEFNGSAFVMIRPGRPGRRAAAGADRERREGQGAVQPAAVRRHRRRSDRQGQGCSIFGSYERRRERSQVVVTVARSGRARSCRRRPTSTRATPRSTCASPRSNSLGVRYNMVRWQKDNESGGLQPAGHRHSSGTTTSTRSTAPSRRSSRERMPERGPRPVLALHRPPRGEVRLRVDSARQGYSTSGGYDFRARGACCPRRPTTSRPRCRCGRATTR